MVVNTSCIITLPCAWIRNKARELAVVSEFDLEADQTEYWYTITSPFDVELATFIKAAGEKSIIYQTKWNGNSSGICRAFFGSFKSVLTMKCLKIFRIKGTTW